MLKRKKVLRIIEALIFASEKAIHLNILKKNSEFENINSYLLKFLKDYEVRGINLKVSDNMWYFETSPDLSEYLKEHKIIRKIIKSCYGNVINCCLFSTYH